MAVVTKKSRPLAVQVFFATPFESTLLEQTMKRRFSKVKTRHVVADKASDSAPWTSNSEEVNAIPLLPTGRTSY